MHTADPHDPHDVCAVLDRLNAAHRDWLAGHEQNAVIGVEHVRREYPHIYAAMELRWDLGTAPAPGAIEWPAWYAEQHADHTEAVYAA